MVNRILVQESFMKLDMVAVRISFLCLKIIFFILLDPFSVLVDLTINYFRLSYN